MQFSFKNPKTVTTIGICIVLALLIGLVLYYAPNSTSLISLIEIPEGIEAQIFLDGENATLEDLQEIDNQTGQTRFEFGVNYETDSIVIRIESIHMPNYVCHTETDTLSFFTTNEKYYGLLFARSANGGCENTPLEENFLRMLQSLLDNSMMNNYFCSYTNIQEEITYFEQNAPAAGQSIIIRVVEDVLTSACVTLEEGQNGYHIYNGQTWEEVITPEIETTTLWETLEQIFLTAMNQ